MTNKAEDQIPSPINPKPEPAPAPIPGVALQRPADLPPGNHYAGRDRAKMFAEYRYLWSICTLAGPQAVAALESARFIMKNISVFSTVATAVGGIPPYIVGAISVMEMGLNFKGTILNGDDFTKPTHNYPPGLGPWGSWEEAAIWGLKHEARGWGINLQTWNWRDPGAAFYFMESYNGHNARMEDQGPKTKPPYSSPYVYSGTPFYVSGKKQENPSRFNPDLVSQQPGCMAILKAIDLNHTRVFT